jgi:hypothetical protein
MLDLPNDVWLPQTLKIIDQIGDALCEGRRDEASSLLNWLADSAHLCSSGSVGSAITRLLSSFDDEVPAGGLLQQLHELRASISNF